MSASVRYVQWSADAQPSSTASCTPGPKPSWLACSRSPSPAARPASSTARHWSASNAPCSQNASIQRACGAHGGQHLAAHQRDVVVVAAGELRRHHMGAEERRLLGEPARRLERRDLGVDVEPVPALDLDRRRSRAAASSTSTLARADAARSARRVASTVVMMPPAVVRRARHAGLELGRAIPAEDDVAVAVDEPGQHAHSADVGGAIGCRRRRRFPSPRPFRRRPRSTRCG